MCALHVSPLPMLRGNPMAPAPYPMQHNRSHPDQFPMRGAAEPSTTEPFPKRRRMAPSPDEVHQSLQPPMRAYPSHAVSSGAVQNSGRPHPSMANMDPYRPVRAYEEFHERPAPRYAPMEPHRDRRAHHAPSSSLPGLSALLQSSSNSPQPPHRLDPVVQNRNQRTMSWSSNGSPADSPLVSTGRPLHWGHATVDNRQRELRGAYGPYYHHQQRLCQSQGRELFQRPPVANNNSPTPSSQSGDEPIDDHRAPSSTGSAGGKNSRYLREMDRRAILERLANGEKQATLAKEFQVSRAAICNLNKHRDEVMSRADENPFAKHPKKRKGRKAAAPTGVSPRIKPEETVTNGNKDAMAKRDEPTLTAVHVVQSRAVQLLMTTLRSHMTPLAEFRRCSERVMRLVIEDALALVPTKPVDVYLNDQVKVEGVGMEHAPCGISMEQRHCPMMDMFHMIEPDQPTGYVRVGHGGSHPDAMPSVTLLDAHLPASLRFHNVFVFDLVATSGEALLATIQVLKDRGAVESMVHVVALFVSSDVVASIQCTFPSVQIVTAQIDASLSKKTRTLDNMLARFAQVYGDAAV